MKEQDAAHSFEKEFFEVAFVERYIKLRENLNLVDAMRHLYNEHVVPKEAELTRLRSELQQAKQEIANHIAVNSLLTDSDGEVDLANKLYQATSELQQKDEETTALKMKSEAQLQSYLYTTNTLTKKLQQERDRIRTLHQTLIARFYNDQLFNKDSLSKIIDEVGDLLK